MIPKVSVSSRNKSSTKSAMQAVIAGVTLAISMLIFCPPASAAVDVESFRAQGSATSIVVSWRTGTELGNRGFKLLKAGSEGGPYAEIAQVPSKCWNCVLGQSYAVTDSAIKAGQSYFYKLRTVDTGKEFGPVAASAGAIAISPTPKSTTPTTTNTRMLSVSPASPVAPKSATPTSTSAPLALNPSATTTRVPVRSATPTLSPQPTPATKIARAILPADPIAPTSVRAAEPKMLSTPSPVPQVAEQMASPSVDTEEITAREDAGEGPPDEGESQQRLPAETGQVLVGLAFIGLAGLLGLGSFVSAAVAIVLLLRTTSGR